MKYIKFACGCSFSCSDDGKVQLSLDWDELNLECPATWKLISDGNTKGCFQIESQLCQKCCKQAPVRSVEDLSSVIAIVRPGCGESFLKDGKNLTHHYLERKANREEIEYLHPVLEKYLKNTQGILVFQEQMMFITMDLAGFTEIEADDARKAAGKKLPELMAKIKVKFIDGCKKVGKVGDEDAATIWSWIEASQRYSFNSGHSTSYADLSYFTAYLKAHFPLQFFTSWLSFAEEKINKHEEIQQLTNNLRKMDLVVTKPSYVHLNKHFTLIDEEIHFGFCDLKGIGAAAFDKLLKVTADLESKLGPREKWSYLTHQFHLLPALTSTTAETMIKSGAFDHILSNRTLFLYEYNRIKELSPKEMEWAVSNYLTKSDLLSILRSLLVEFKFKQPARKKKIEEQIKLLENPPFSLKDSISTLMDDEKRIMGIALSCSSVDSCDISSANTTCKDWSDGVSPDKYVVIAANIDLVKEWKVKNGKNAGQLMGSLTISDSTCSIDGILVFGETWENYKTILTEGNTVLIGGKKSKNNSSLIVEKVWQL